MHELSIVEGLLGIIDETARQHGLTRVTAVNLTIGALRQVVPESLRFAFEVSTRGTAAEGAVVNIADAPVCAECRACKSRFEVTDMNFACRACGGADLSIVGGQELYITSIEGDS